MVKVKGMFFTLGLTLLATVLFSLTILIVTNSEVSKEAATDFVIADRLYELDSSIQNSLAEIFKSKSGISISGTTFQESLPNGNYSVFNDGMTDYKNYTESTYDNIELNISRIIDELPIYIPRYDVTYYHNFGENKINVSNSNSINGYVVEVVGLGTVGCDSNNFVSGSLRLYVPNCPFDTQVSSVQLTLNGVGSGVVISLFGNELQITNTGNTKTIKTEILVPDNQVAMYYPGGIININFLEFGVQKSGSVRIM